MLGQAPKLNKKTKHAEKEDLKKEAKLLDHHVSEYNRANKTKITRGDLVKIAGGLHLIKWLEFKDNYPGILSFIDRDNIKDAAKAMMRYTKEKHK